MNLFEKSGFKVEEVIYYDEYEYKGRKPFDRVKNRLNYINGRPACYLIAITKQKVNSLTERKTKNQYKL